jgi:hypothetical protein
VIQASPASSAGVAGRRFDAVKRGAFVNFVRDPQTGFSNSRSIGVKPIAHFTGTLSGL